MEIKKSMFVTVSIQLLRDAVALEEHTAALLVDIRIPERLVEIYKTLKEYALQPDRYQLRIKVEGKESISGDIDADFDCTV